MAYWKHVLQRVIAVTCTLEERGLILRSALEELESSHKDNFSGLLELISQFDSFLATHKSKYGNLGTGKMSYLPKTHSRRINHGNGSKSSS
ncbi:hypothetical protein NPIL_165361 [Nephila pilipes]|uniref:Uncharacterized protein n=1 Tax=Nephila pilipes TaxID=299642 RepID=A0A8X6UHP7_NEPPI|nr:hypothetical protein NPIL_165361 [Nephila pilipes]